MTHQHHPHDEHAQASAAHHEGHGAQPSHGDHGAHGGHTGHAGHGDHVAQFRRLFWIMLVFALPVVAFDAMFASLVGYPLPRSGWATWISPVLGTVMYVWGGRPFLTGAVDEIRGRWPGLMLLFGLATTVAFLASLIGRAAGWGRVGD